MFVKESVFLKNNKLRKIITLRELDLIDTNNHKVKCELGVASIRKKLKPLEQKKLDDMMKGFLIRITTYLLQSLPLNKQVLRDVRVIHPNYSLDDKCTAAISCLASFLWRALGQRLFCLN